MRMALLIVPFALLSACTDDVVRDGTVIGVIVAWDWVASEDRTLRRDAPDAPGAANAPGKEKTDA